MAQSPEKPLNTDKFIAYYRVSTQRQGRSGLGLEAQRKAVMDWLNGGHWELVAEYTEIESGKRCDRPQLDKALRECKRLGAAMAEHERRMISARTKAALQRAKVRGVKLGQYGKILPRQNATRAREQAKELRPIIREIRRSGKTSVRRIMAELNRRGIKTSRGGTWHPHTVNVLLRRIDGKTAR